LNTKRQWRKDKGTQGDGSIVLTENSRFLPPLPKGRGTDRQVGGGRLPTMSLTDRMVKEHKRTVPLCSFFSMCFVIYNIPLATNIATAEALILALERGDLDWRDIVNPKR